MSSLQLKSMFFVGNFSGKPILYLLQRLLDYLIYQELTASSQAKQSDVDALAKEVNKNWWDNNKHRFITE